MKYPLIESRLGEFQRVFHAALAAALKESVELNVFCYSLKCREWVEKSIFPPMTVWRPLEFQSMEIHLSINLSTCIMNYFLEVELTFQTIQYHYFAALLRVYQKSNLLKKKLPKQ